MDLKPSTPSSWRMAILVVAAGIVVTGLVVMYLDRSDVEDPKRLLLSITVLAGVAITALAFALVVMLAREQRRSQHLSLQMTDRLADRERALMQSNRELERFATVAAHDLQEPLRTILTFTDLTDRRFGASLDPEARDYMLRVAGAAARMRNLIDDLLTYARIGQEERQFVAVELRDAVDAALANVERLVLDTGAQITIGELPTVTGNPQGLQQLFTNLLSNALKYTLTDQPMVRIESQRKDRDWIIAVADNGKGIDPVNHERIFELFRRLEARGVSGTGLGLAICARIVDAHGGRIWVRSEVGKGATFYFTLPVHRAPEPGRPARNRPGIRA
jgi:light-regulated signal transduction histidine kinase (bacteriophytochrome)